MCSIVMVGVLVMATALADASGERGNLLENSSFEVAVGEELQAEMRGWRRWTEAGWTGQLTWDGRAGRQSGSKKNEYAAWAKHVGGRGGWITDSPVPVVPGTDYLLAGFLAANRAAGEVRLSIRFMAAERVLSERYTPAVTGSTGAGVADWVAVAVRGRAPEGSTGMHVLCRADHLVGEAWFEDLVLVETGQGAREETTTLPRLPGSQRVHTGTGFGEALEVSRKKLEREAMKLREEGKFWQAASVATGRARVLTGCGLMDLEAGRRIRGLRHLRMAAGEVARAQHLLKLGRDRRDPLPSSATKEVLAGIVMPMRYPYDRALLKESFASLARIGFVEAQVDFPWGVWEPEPGRYDFSDIDFLLGLAARNGMKLHALCGPKYAHVRGRYPDSPFSLLGFTPWYMNRHPESSLVSAAGERIRDCDGLFWDFAFVNPVRLSGTPNYVRTWQESLSELGRHSGRHPALGGWLLSQRPVLGEGPSRVRNLAKAGLLGHNHEYVEAFRHWLKEKYGEPSALKGAWGRKSPETFSRADPPGSRDIDVSASHARRRYSGSRRRIADWLRFRATFLAEGLAWQADLLRRLSPGRAAIPKWGGFTLTGPLDPDGVAADLAGSVGVGEMALDLAADAIPVPLLTHGQDVALAVASASRRPLILTEYALRPQGLLSRDDRQDLIPAAQVAAYVWSAVLSGARGFFFQGWQGAPGPASVELPGTGREFPNCVSDEGVALALAARELKALGGWLAGARPAGLRYALLVSWETMLFDDPEGLHPLGLLNLLSAAGVNGVEVITVAQVERRDLAHDVIFAPHVTWISDRAAKELRSFVSNGGVLIADSFLGSSVEPMAHGMASFFGIEFVRSGTVYDEGGTIGANVTAAFSALPAKIPISLSHFSGGHHGRLKPGTRVLAEYTGGKPGKNRAAVTVRSRGDGKAVMIPRLRIARAHVRALQAERILRPAMWVQSAARRNPELSGFFLAVFLRSLLAQVDALPAARLLRAPVSDVHLKRQAQLLRDAGIEDAAIRHSENLLKETQSGIPYLSTEEVRGLERDFGVDVQSYAPIRVGMLAGKDGGRIVVAANLSSLGRDVTLIVPKAPFAVDILAGEELEVKDGRLKTTLAEYQVRVFALEQSE